MSKTNILLIFLFLVTLANQAQNDDPHANDDSYITGMPSEKILMILEITVHDSLQYQTYRLKAEPVIEKFGGIYLVRSGGMAFDPDPDRKIIPLEGNCSKTASEFSFNKINYCKAISGKELKLTKVLIIPSTISRNGQKKQVSLQQN